MPVLQSRGSISGSIVTWFVEYHTFEFTVDELKDMVQAIRASRLFVHLDETRPALSGQLRAIRPEIDAEMEERDFEFLLEQSLLDLAQRFRH